MMRERHRFRFGVQIASASSNADWCEKARRAEALGYDILVMPDHHIGGQLAYAPALAAAASATRQLRIGTLVLATDFRKPAAIAADAATLDLLSNGRFELGLGTGGSLLADYERNSIPFDAPSVRIAQFTESLQVIKRLFTEETVSFAGRYVNVQALSDFPPPVQRPHPPFLIGAGGPRMLTLAAREADIISIPPRLSPHGQFDLTELRAEVMDAKVARIREVAGERFGQLELHMLLQVVAITDDWRAVAAAVGNRWGMTEAEVRASPYSLLGTIEEVVALLQARRRRFGLSYYTVFEREMETFAPVIARITAE